MTGENWIVKADRTDDELILDGLPDKIRELSKPTAPRRVRSVVEWRLELGLPEPDSQPQKEPPVVKCWVGGKHDGD